LRGLTTVPAVILLPVLAALGYFWLNEAGVARLHRLELLIAPNFTFAFFPLLHLPFAVVLAFGLWIYARVRLVHALLVVALVETLALGVSYVYQAALSYVIAQRDLAVPHISLLANAGATMLFGICYLLAASVWAPGLREGRRWLFAIVLWTLWGVAAVWVVREFRLTGTPGALVGLSTRVFMAACIGYWLWREQAAEIWSRSPVIRTAPATQRPPVRATTGAPAVAERDWRGTALGLLLIVLGFFAFRAVAPLNFSRGFAMGPGAMPLVLSIMLVALGAIAAIEGRIRKRLIVPASLAPLIWVLGAALAFWLAIRPLGLAAASTLTTAIVAVYALRGRPGPIIAVVIVSVAIALAVTTSLELPIPLWPNLRGW
jgi:hypothetical protein